MLIFYDMYAPHRALHPPQHPCPPRRPPALHSLVYAVFMGNYDSPQQVQRVAAVQGLVAAALR